MSVVSCLCSFTSNLAPLVFETRLLDKFPINLIFFLMINWFFTRIVLKRLFLRDSADKIERGLRIIIFVIFELISASNELIRRNLRK